MVVFGSESRELLVVNWMCDIVVKLFRVYVIWLVNRCCWDGDSWVVEVFNGMVIILMVFIDVVFVIVILFGKVVCSIVLRGLGILVVIV